ncbi:hypothetical protein PanWU01x14_208810, partial [Parasponia andersonii]
GSGPYRPRPGFSQSPRPFFPSPPSPSTSLRQLTRRDPSQLRSPLPDSFFEVQTTVAALAFS